MRTWSRWISFPTPSSTPNAEQQILSTPAAKIGPPRSGWQSLLGLLFQQLHQKLLRGYHPRNAAPAESYRRLGTAGNRRASRAKARQLCLQAGDFVTEVMHPAA